MAEIEAALGPQRLGIEFQLTRRDYQHLQWYHLRRHKISALALVAMVLVGSGLVGLIRHSVYLAVITALFVVAAVGALTWTQWQALQQNPGLFRRHSLFISPAGLWLRTPGQGDGLMEWSAIVEVVADAKYLMLFYGPNLALLVSRRAFPSAEEADRFLQRACEWQAAHAAPKPG